MKLRRAALAALAATVALAPISQSWANPRVAHLRPAMDSDEGGLWAESDKAEAHAKASAALDRDVALNGYVDGLVGKLAPEYAGDLRVYVMDRPFVNAQTAPNGYVEIWSGLLLRAETEDELAFVLSHEIGHFQENHSIEAWRALKTRANVALTLSIALAIGGAAAGASMGGTTDAMRLGQDLGQIASDLVYLGAIASYFSYSRENESEADRLGFARATAAGYDPAAGAAMMRLMMDEASHSDFNKVRVQEARFGIFNSHPIDAERAKALDALAADKPKGASGDPARYRAIIRPYLGAWLKDDLRRRDFGESLYLIDRLSARGEDLGVLGYYRGEAFRMRRSDGDLAKAEAAYAEAVSHPDAPAAAWRELGDQCARNHETAKAREAYQAYLDHAPQAQDRWLVEAGLKKLSEGTAS